jgi:hypothetical protein
MKLKYLIFTAVMLLSFLSAEDMKDKVVFGSTVKIETGDTVKEAVSIGGDVVVNGIVEKNAVSIGGTLTLGPKAFIMGDAVAIGGEIVKHKNAKIGGNTVSVNRFLVLFIPVIAVCALFIAFVIFIVKLIAGVLLTSIAVFLFPKQIENTSTTLVHAPVRSLLWGIVGSLLLVPFICVLALTVIGIPLIPVTLFVIGLSVFFGYISIARLLGQRVFIVFKKPKIGIVWETFIGILLLIILSAIPWIGGFLSFTACVFGFGAVLIEVRSWQKQKSGGKKSAPAQKSSVKKKGKSKKK